ncbi:hypothetical protein Cgig2_005334 [Carnegiea gigantea]|uniref:Uncharacterized protein n=1 Tax=Carnegiea gigantea TaxID=171969 RepID=A0A9Q1K742_9CARY|nr:hypothetical protein Cgig2_005334 [Carnegiea gigantea]
MASREFQKQRARDGQRARREWRENSGRRTPREREGLKDFGGGGKYCARINYVEKRLVEVRIITDAFPCLKDTVLASDIGAAFRSHKDNEAYLFKGPHYALLRYSGETNLAGWMVKEIKPNWPSLRGFLPRENFGLDYYAHPNPPPDRPHDEF